MKKCSICGKIKQLNDFHKVRKNQPALRRHCKKCGLEMIKRYKKENPNKVKAWDREGFVKYKYGLDKEQYGELKKKFPICAICGTSELLGIDHNHETGEVRGRLCRKCNSAIGLLNDDLELLFNAVAYLLNTSQKVLD